MSMIMVVVVVEKKVVVVVVLVMLAVEVREEELVKLEMVHGTIVTQAQEIEERIRKECQ